MSSMLRDGKYPAWFRTSRGEGTGIIHLADGRISGGDCFFSYGGLVFRDLGSGAGPPLRGDAIPRYRAAAGA